MLLLFLLLIAMHIYIDAADDQSKTFPSTVTIKKVDGEDHITYKRTSSAISPLAAMMLCSTSEVLNDLPDCLLYDSINITFPAKLLFQSKTLKDVLDEDPDIVRKNSYHESLTLATQWLLDDQNLHDIPLIIDTLKACSASQCSSMAEYRAMLSSSDVLRLTNDIVIQKLFNYVPNLITHPNDLQNIIIVPGLLAALTDSQMNLLAHFAEFFGINDLSEGIACHLTQKPKRLSTVSNIQSELEMLIKSKLNFRSLGTLLYEKRKPTVTTFKDSNKYHYYKFSPDGTKKIIKNPRNSNNITVFDAQSGKLIFDGEGTANHAKNIIYGKDKDSDAWGFHFLDKTQFFPLTQNKEFAYIKFSPDGKTFAARGYYDHDRNHINLYNLDQYIQQNSLIQPFAHLFLRKIGPNNYHLTRYNNNQILKISYRKDGSELLIYTDTTCTAFDAQSLQALGDINTDKPIIKASYTDEGNIKIKTDLRSIHDLDKPPRTHLYKHINFATLPLEHIGTLYEVAQHWQQHKQPYTIANVETLQRLLETIPELVIKSKSFFEFNTKTKKALLDQLMTNLQSDLLQSIGNHIQYLDLQDADLRWIKFLYKANPYWQNKTKCPLNTKQFELLLTKNIRLEVIIELFDITRNIYNHGSLVTPKNVVNNFLEQLKLERHLNINYNEIDRLSRINTLPYFILLLKQITTTKQPYTIPDNQAHLFFNFKKVIDETSNLNQVINNRTLFNCKSISTDAYKDYLYEQDTDHFMHKGINLEQLNRSQAKWLLKVRNVWHRDQPFELITKKDVDTGFALRHLIDRDREQCQKPLFTLSKKSNQETRKSYELYVDQCLQEKKIFKEKDNLQLLKDLNSKQLDLLFNASYQKYRLTNADIAYYTQLPDVCQDNKLFDTQILDIMRNRIRREFEQAKLSRTVRFFAGLRQSLKKFTTKDIIPETYHDILKN